MPLASTIPLSPHFLASELGADKPEANDDVLTNLRLTAQGLERIRSVLESRLQANTSRLRNRGFRTPEENASVGGSPTSAHLSGLAADFVALDFRGTMAEAYQTLRDNDIGPFDQIIFYPTTGHIHVSFDGRRRGEFRVHLAEGVGGTPLLGSDFVQQLGGTVAYAVSVNPVGALAVVFGIILLIAAASK